VDIAVVGAGAAGLMAAIWAGRTAAASGRAARIVALDGARTLGAKILVAGGGRCNVTHHHVDETGYACGPGTTRNAIRKVLRAFDVPRTVAFFAEVGVDLKREETGKLFPVTDDARTVLNALLRAARDVGVEIRHPRRVGAIHAGDADEPFIIEPDASGVQAPTTPIAARRVILATGGKALPKTGSDGQGYVVAQSLGHSITEPIFPALVPLIVDPARSFITSLSGLTLPATLTLRSASGKTLTAFTDSTLCTHFGISGPSVLDISRHWLSARATDAAATLTINWIPGQTPESLDHLLAAERSASAAAKFLARFVPERLARALCQHVALDPAQSLDQLRREPRRALARACTDMLLPIIGDRGFAHAEATAGGVPLSELHLSTMASRIHPGLHICGEICDVDGRIGGFNFQWAWASGYLAGVRAAASLTPRQPGADLS